jgi:UDP-glucuronate decarboxylase
MNNPHFEFVCQDILEDVYIECDQIYNLACPASPVHYQYDPIKTGKTSVIGALHTLGLAKRCHARILQASTSEVYGDPQVHPQPETYRGSVNPNGVRACYDEGKRMAETLFFDYHRQHNVDIKIVRIFNTYGPKMRSDDGRVISNFIVEALNNRDITIYGDGMQTRSFCYVDDLVDGMQRMMNSDSEFTGPLNLGNTEEITMIQLAELIIKLTQSKSNIVFLPLPQDDPIRRKPVIELAKKKLDWMPKIRLEDGIKRTIEYFKTLNTGQITCRN